MSKAQGTEGRYQALAMQECVIDDLARVPVREYLAPIQNTLKLTPKQSCVSKAAFLLFGDATSGNTNPSLVGLPTIVKRCGEEDPNGLRAENLQDLSSQQFQEIYADRVSLAKPSLFATNDPLLQYLRNSF
jgi:hypothetical protein